MKDYAVFLKFMTEYADFFDEVLKREEEKFMALYSRNPKRMDAAFNLHIETEEQIAQIEDKRIKLNNEMGCEGMTLRQIIESLPEDEPQQKLELDKIFQRLRFSVQQTKEFNQKSLEYAQMNLDIVDKINGIFTDSPTYTADGASTNKVTRPNILNKKA